MKEFLSFAGENPITAVVLALIVSTVVVWPFRLVKGWIRHRNIVARGWPPAHLDADGDVIDNGSES